MLNSLIVKILPYLPPALVWQFSRQYIAGKTIAEAITEAKKLNEGGMMTTLDVLGEFITRLDEAEANKKEYLQVIEKAESAGVQGNYSLKPTFFGLLLDPEVCYQHIREVVMKAAAARSFIRIDMEDSPCTQLTIDIFRRLRTEFPRHVGLVFQAYLKRTLADIQSLQDLHSAEHPLNFRICKGIYVEPAEIAHKGNQSINRNYLTILEYMIEQGMYPAIATHDRKLVEGAKKLISQYQLPKERYEFQMLYGVTPALRHSLVSTGHRLRVYVPFGKHWFGYSTRRLKENPQMAGVIIKALFARG